MVRAARKSGLILQVGMNNRFTGPAQFMKQYIDDGNLGDVYYARAQALRRRGVPGWGVFIDKEKQGGGPLIDIGVHILDLTLHFMGFPKPVSASGMTWNHLGTNPALFNNWGDYDRAKFTVEDFAVGLIRFDNGAVVVLESSFMGNLEGDPFQRLPAQSEFFILRMFVDRRRNDDQIAQQLTVGRNPVDLSVGQAMQPKRLPLRLENRLQLLLGVLPFQQDPTGHAPLIRHASQAGNLLVFHFEFPQGLEKLGLRLDEILMSQPQFKEQRAGHDRFPGHGVNVSDHPGQGSGDFQMRPSRPGNDHRRKPNRPTVCRKLNGLEFFVRQPQIAAGLRG